jgi:hypothetical protein
MSNLILYRPTNKIFSPSTLDCPTIKIVVREQIRSQLLYPGKINFAEVLQLRGWQHQKQINCLEDPWLIDSTEEHCLPAEWSNALAIARLKSLVRQYL